MPSTRLSSIWAQIPWRRRKEEPQDSVSAKRKSNAPLRRGEWRPFSRNGVDNFSPIVPLRTSEAVPRRVKPIWKNEDISESSATRTLSASYRRSMRTFTPKVPRDDSSEFGSSSGATPSLNTTVSEETFMKRMRRKSQQFSLPRPRTSSGASRRFSFFGSAIPEGEEDDIPALPGIPEQQTTRPRHIPITIDYLQVPLEGEENHINKSQPDEAGPGMAITSNDVQRAITPPKQRSRPLSVARSFSQLRLRSARNIFRSSRTSRDLTAELSDSEDHHDAITALPSLDAKDLHRPTSNLQHTTQQFSDGPYASVDRKLFQRATPTVVDIVSPRPLSMITASNTTPKPRSRPGTANATSHNSVSTTTNAARHRSMFSPPTLLINDEDGPKGDWSRTRHSWLANDGTSSASGSEQLEWEKLKQFIEAYSIGAGVGAGGSGGGAVGNNGELGVVSIRQVEDESDSSGTEKSRSQQQPQPKFSNAQALAALEFGLN